MKLSGGAASRAARSLIIATITLTAVVGVAGCSSPASTSTGGNDGGQAQAAPAAPLDLAGTWTEIDAGSSTQTAVIGYSTITINWVNDDTKALYWEGSYVAPTSALTTYTWDSAADASKMQGALLASRDSSKTFSYDNGILSYDVTAMGVTKTVKLERK